MARLLLSVGFGAWILAGLVEALIIAICCGLAGARLIAKVAPIPPMPSRITAPVR